MSIKCLWSVFLFGLRSSHEAPKEDLPRAQQIISAALSLDMISGTVHSISNLCPSTGTFSKSAILSVPYGSTFSEGNVSSSYLAVKTGALS
jgi:hypothetical protein